MHESLQAAWQPPSQVCEQVFEQECLQPPVQVCLHPPEQECLHPFEQPSQPPDEARVRPSREVLSSLTGALGVNCARRMASLSSSDKGRLSAKSRRLPAPSINAAAPPKPIALRRKFLRASNSADLVSFSSPFLLTSHLVFQGPKTNHAATSPPRGAHQKRDLKHF